MNFINRELVGILGIVSIVLFAGYVVYILHQKNKKETISKIEKHLEKAAEKAYFEGQKDYMEGDIRIFKKNNIYYWKKSPWNCGTLPSFNPSLGYKKDK